MRRLNGKFFEDCRLSLRESSARCIEVTPSIFVQFVQAEICTRSCWKLESPWRNLRLFVVVVVVVVVVSGKSIHGSASFAEEADIFYARGGDRL